MDRWTMKDLNNTDDLTFAECVLNERARTINPYSPLAEKIKKTIATLEVFKAELIKQQNKRG
jgi:hypothetical protein